MVDHLPPVTLGRNWVKQGLRVLPIAAALGPIFCYVSTGKKDTVLKGTWKVEKLTRNGHMASTNAWLTDTTVWCRACFSGWQGVTFSPNQYRYKPKESWRGNYGFDSTKNWLRLIMYRSKAAKVSDTIRANVMNRTTKAMRLRGVFCRDTVEYVPDATSLIPLSHTLPFILTLAK